MAVRAQSNRARERGNKRLCHSLRVARVSLAVLLRDVIRSPTRRIDDLEMRSGRARSGVRGSAKTSFCEGIDSGEPIAYCLAGALNS